MINENKIRQIYKSNREQGFSTVGGMFSGTDILLYTAFGSAARRCGGCIAGSLYSGVQALGAIPLREFTEHMDLPDCNE